MSRTVDLVISGGGHGAVAAADAALRQGRRVLVLLRAGDRRAERRLRRRLHKVAMVHDGRLTVATNAAVVCVDGVDGVEVVVIRHARTGRLSAVNAAAFLRCDGATTRGRGAGRERGPILDAATFKES